MNEIARVCIAARMLIIKEGWTTGGEGWTNLAGGGWCLEGALGRVLGINHMTEDLSRAVNDSAVGEAIRSHLMLLRHRRLHQWNDYQGRREAVLQMLAEVAAKHTEQPKDGEVILPPMPIEKSKRSFRELLVDALTS